MTTNPALLQLKDIHLPHGLSPIMLAWGIISILSAILFLLGIYYWYTRRHRTLHYSLKQLQFLRTLLLHNPNQINVAAELSTLIRRAALHYFERETIASLTGTTWLQFLNDSGHTNQFTGHYGKLLIETPYRKYHQEELSPLIELTEAWLRNVAKQKRKGQ